MALQDESTMEMSFADDHAGSLLWELQAQFPRLVIAFGVLLAVYVVGFAVWSRVAGREDSALDRRFVRGLRIPCLLLTPVVSLWFVLPGMGDGASVESLRRVTSVVSILLMTWMSMSVVRGAGALIRSRHDVSVSDNYAARRMHTQVALLSRIAIALILIVGVGLALMAFPRVRELGTSLLASAGIAGLIVGFAARPVLENLIAGVQLALTQPIAIDDVVIIDGEWGKVEQITSTYVVVRIWDDRRLICPFSKFITESFQNWTRRRSEILGTVFLYADYTLPVDEVRTALRSIVADHPLWDGRVCVLQVTEATPTAMQLRALVSARNASEAWDLRVDVRERLITYLQRSHPSCLPRTRVSLREGDDAGSGSGFGQDPGFRRWSLTRRPVS